MLVRMTLTLLEIRIHIKNLVGIDPNLINDDHRYEIYKCYVKNLILKNNKVGKNNNKQPHD